MKFGKGVATSHLASVDSEHVTVTAAEFTRKFGQLTKVHRNAPIHVTNHGQETHVLLASDVYAKLTREPVVGGDAPSESQLPSLIEIGAWIRQGLIVVDRDMMVRYANPVAHMMANLPDGALTGRQYFETLPQHRETLLGAYLQRALCGGERQTADFPSNLRADAWYRGDFIPCRDGAMLLMTDITDDVQRYRLADAKRALVMALDAHGGIGYVRINVRARIERVDATFAELLAMPEERLIGNYITDLVPISERVAFKEQLEGVLSGDSTVTCETKLITNAGNVIEVKVAIAELRGTYGGEGAVLVVTDGIGEDAPAQEMRPLRRQAH